MVKIGEWKQGGDLQKGEESREKEKWGWQFSPQLVELRGFFRPRDGNSENIPPHGTGMETFFFP
ncbi:hypothetical protein SLEP1_g30779 [Rubroshorea leprosula]|uniref:Uncharacterized protein n=1 Tax=Rubroshorea leprosula TaxID=152421 RepID=A0AAV5K9A7_9ROSI|nr:hypothetical protein SLEP1_g30779 [Rubroshorea leprosula]